jgi:hypothetical protein
MRVRSLLGAAGAAAVIAGVAVVLDPSLASAFGPTPDRLLVVALAALALLQGLAAAASRIGGDGRAADLPAVEQRFRATVPGDAFEDRLAALPEHSVSRRDEERAAIRERLEGLAVSVLVDRGLDEAAARRHLEAGTWTTDDAAAIFFMPAADRGLSLERRVRDALGPDVAFVRRARRTVAAITAHAEGEVPPPGDAATAGGDAGE